MKFKAFTLAELLIALSILGVLATFTIPKILSAQAEAEKKSVFKETIAALNAVSYSGWLTGALVHDGSNLGTYMTANLNALKICPTHSIVQGCHMGPVTGSEGAQAGVLLHSGAVVTGFGNFPGPGYDAIIVDWNGSDAPNVEGDDQLWIVVLFSDGIGNGTVKAVPWLSAPSNLLWASIFQ